MNRQRWVQAGVCCLIGMLTVQLLAGCTQKKERTRDDDREQIKKILARLEDGAVRREPEAFEKVVGLSFDGAAFINAVWSGTPEGTVSLRDVRLRISPDDARVVLEVVHTRPDSAQTRKFIGLDLLYRDKTWKFTGFQDAGSQPEM